MKEAAPIIAINTHLAVRDQGSNPSPPTHFLNLNFLTCKIGEIISFVGVQGRLVKILMHMSFLELCLVTSQRSHVTRNNNNYKGIDISVIIYTEALNSIQFSCQRVKGGWQETKSDVYHNKPKSRKDVTTFIYST